MANNELSMAGHWDSCQWSDEDRTFMINTLDEVIGGLEYIRSKIRNKETVVSEDWQKAAIPFRKAMDSFIAYTMKSTDPSMPFIPQTKGNELEKSQSQNNMMIFGLVKLNLSNMTECIKQVEKAKTASEEYAERIFPGICGILTTQPWPDARQLFSDAFLAGVEWMANHQ